MMALFAKSIVRQAKGIEIMLERLVPRRSNIILIPFAGLTVFLAPKRLLVVRNQFGTLRYIVQKISTCSLHVTVKFQI